MRTWLINLWDSFRTGFWFFPTLMIAAAIALAIVVPEIDRRMGDSTPDWLMSTGSTARSTLAALASAMFTVAGVVFSATIVTLSMTSSQFGPRLLRSFLEENVTQITLGACLACSVYCLILLWRIDDVNDSWFVPHLAVFLATVFTLIALCAVVYFIHRVAHSIQSMNVVTDIASDLDSAAARLFPEESDYDQDWAKNQAALQQRFRSEQGAPVRALGDGYLQAINTESLIELANDRDLVLRIVCRPGDFLIKDHVVAEYLPEQDDNDSTAMQLGRAFIVGNRRTPRQDFECAISELTEIAVRALSPGINDPFTAVASIDRLGATLCRLVNRDLRAVVRVNGDDSQQTRICCTPTEFSGVLSAAFDQIRQYGATSVAVSIRLLETLAIIAMQTTHDSDREAVRRQADLVVEGCSKQDYCEGDMLDVARRYEHVLEVCRRNVPLEAQPAAASRENDRQRSQATSTTTKI